MLLATAPAIAQDRWSHPASGASFAKVFEGQSLVEQRDLGTPNDMVVDFESNAGLESTTFYIFQASVPNARLWFDRAMPVVANDIPMAMFDAGPVEKIAAFGSPAPNALRQIFTARQEGPFKSTALVVAQSGPWIVKMRATSASLDRAGLAARIDRHLAAIGMKAPAFAARLDEPPPCAVAPGFGAGTPVAKGIEQAAAAAVIIHARLHGPADPFCQADAANARFTLLGVIDRPEAWLLLTGDAGKAIGSEPIATGAGPSPQLVYVATPAATRGAALFGAPPSLQAAVTAAAPLLTNPADGLFGIATGAAGASAAKAD